MWRLLCLLFCILYFVMGLISLWSKAGCSLQYFYAPGLLLYAHFGALYDTAVCSLRPPPLSNALLYAHYRAFCVCIVCLLQGPVSLSLLCDHHGILYPWLTFVYSLREPCVSLMYAHYGSLAPLDCMLINAYLVLVLGVILSLPGRLSPCGSQTGDSYFNENVSRLLLCRL